MQKEDKPSNNAAFENAQKRARSTIAVAGLYDPDLLFEVEAVAVYPAKK